MTRKARIVTSLVASCGLAVALYASAEQIERRIEIIRHVRPSGELHVAPVAVSDYDVHVALPAMPGMPGMPGGPGAMGHTAEIHAALNGPAGALSTPDMLIRHAERLELTDDQVTALKALQVVARKTEVRVSAARQLAEIDVQVAADVTQPNMDLLEAAFQAVAKAQLDQHMLPFRFSREARDELTEAQLAKWDGLLAQRHDVEAMHRAHATMMPSGMQHGSVGRPHIEMRREIHIEHSGESHHDTGDERHESHRENHE